MVCGPDHLTYWRAFADSPEPAPTRASACWDSSPTCARSTWKPTWCIVPTTVSAGTNVKVLEAMAMQRAVVSTTSGCAGLGLLARPQRLDCRYAGSLRRRRRDPHRRPRPPRADRRCRLRARPPQLRLAGDRRKAARLVARVGRAAVAAPVSASNARRRAGCRARGRLRECARAARR